MKQSSVDLNLSKRRTLKQWYFGMKAQIGVDADSGLVQTMRGTSGNVVDMTEGNSSLYGQETNVYGDASYRGADKHMYAKARHKWQVAICLGKRKELDKENKLSDAMIDQAEKIKAGIRAKVKHPFRVIKRQFEFMRVRLPEAKEELLAAQDDICAVHSVDGYLFKYSTVLPDSMKSTCYMNLLRQESKKRH